MLTLFLLLENQSFFLFFFFTGFVLFVHRGYAGEADTWTHTHTHAHPLYLKIISESLKLLKYGWMLPFFGAAATSTCAADEISCYHPGICRVLSNYSFCCSLHRPGIDLQEEGGRYTWGVEEGGEERRRRQKNDVGSSGEISNRTIRRAQGIERKTEGALHALISLITSFQGGRLPGVFLGHRREGKKKSMCEEKLIHL